MAHYLWKGVDVYGNPVEGASETPDINQIIDELRKRNIFNVQFNRVRVSKLQTPLSGDLLAYFLIHFIRLLESGLDIIDCLNFMIRYQANILLSYILCHLRQDLQEGKSLTTAFQRYSSCFPNIFIHLIQVAEKSGNLLEIFGELLTFFEFQNKFSQERRKLLAYPLIVSGIAFIFFIGILLFIVPNFKSMFLSLEGDLPIVTKWMIILSDSLQFSPQYWIIITGCIIFGGIYFQNSINWKWLLRIIPGFYSVEKSIRLLFYARSMMIMLKSGLKIREALEITEGLFPIKMQEEVRGIHKKIDEGKLLTDAYSTSKIFPPLFVHLVAIGESSGFLVPTFDRISILYQEKVEKRMNILNAFMEPLFTIALAFGILIILLSIYLPIFDMADHF